jgi:low affinity Fe/Cu permease
MANSKMPEEISDSPRTGVFGGATFASSSAMVPERRRASDTPDYRPRIDAIARLASARTRTIGVVERISAAATEWTGHTTAFVWALLLVIGWTISGPLFRYSDTWQLFINTVTNLVTFLMVFLIQRAQNKDTMALQLKVNELIAAQKGAHNSLIAIEELSEEELQGLHDRFLRLAAVSRGGAQTSVAAVTVATTPADASYSSFGEVARAPEVAWSKADSAIS